MQHRTLFGLAASAGIVGTLGTTVWVADQSSGQSATYAWRSRALVSHPGDVVPDNDGNADSNL